MPSVPVERIPVDEPDDRPEPGTGLCLSGGGYRAMVFHLGALWRLYEAGLLGGVAQRQAAEIRQMAWLTAAEARQRVPPGRFGQLLEMALAYLDEDCFVC